MCVVSYICQRKPSNIKLARPDQKMINIHQLQIFLKKATETLSFIQKCRITKTKSNMPDQQKDTTQPCDASMNMRCIRSVLSRKRHRLFPCHFKISVSSGYLVSTLNNNNPTQVTFRHSSKSNKFKDTHNHLYLTVAVFL
jgi:hypothetical protein